MLLDATQNMLPEQAPVLQAIQILDRAQAKIALVVDAQGRLTGSVVDGDVRRGLLRGHGLQTPVREIMHRKPYVLPVGASRQKILQAMQVLEIRQVPLVTAKGLVTRITVHDLLLGLQHGERPNRVVVMAGGKGKRLLPMTQNLPKPLVQVGGKPIIEWILLRLRTCSRSVARDHQPVAAGAQEPECTLVHEDSEHRPTPDHGLAARS